MKEEDFIVIFCETLWLGSLVDNHLLARQFVENLNNLNQKTIDWVKLKRQKDDEALKKDWDLVGENGAT